jgi:hypothetical protein
MPTEGKTPLTASETAIIKWWIEKSAAADDKKAGNSKPSGRITKFASAWFG